MTSSMLTNLEAKIAYVAHILPGLVLAKRK